MSLRAAADHLLLGRDFTLSVKLSGLAGAIFLVTFLLRLPAIFGPASMGADPFHSLLILLMVALATGCAYANDGLLISIALAAALSIGFYLPAAFTAGLRPHRTVLDALVFGVGYALVLGTFGFLLGAGGRRLVESVQDSR